VRSRAGPSANPLPRIEAAALTVAAHNGIEYGLMQAYAEGYELLAAEPRITTVDGVEGSWQKGTGGGGGFLSFW
jgi:6-phosphogluconate dehydrogenase (decarboxylating)